MCQIGKGWTWRIRKFDLRNGHEELGWPRDQSRMLEIRRLVAGSRYCEEENRKVARPVVKDVGLHQGNARLVGMETVVHASPTRRSEQMFTSWFP